MSLVGRRPLACTPHMPQLDAAVQALGPQLSASQTFQVRLVPIPLCLSSSNGSCRGVLYSAGSFNLRLILERCAGL